MPPPMSEWVWVQEGSLLWCPYAHGISSGDTHWVAASFWGVQSPFITTPSFMFKYTFWVGLLTSFRQSHIKWSGLPHLKQFLFSFWYNSTALAKQVMYLMDWSASFTLPITSTSSSAEGSVSSIPPVPHLDHLLLHHFQFLQLKQWKCSCPSACMREINSLASENASWLVH